MWLRVNREGDREERTGFLLFSLNVYVTVLVPDTFGLPPVPDCHMRGYVIKKKKKGTLQQNLFSETGEGGEDEDSVDDMLVEWIDE